MNASPTPAQVKEFLNLLHENNQLMLSLSEVIQQQVAFLKERKRKEITPLTEQQQTHIQQIAQSEQKLRHFMASLGFRLDAKGLEQFIQSCPGQVQPMITQHWLGFKENLSRCHQLMQVGDKIIQRSKRNLQHVLSLLKGQDLQHQLYRPNGQKQTPNAGGLLAQA